MEDAKCETRERLQLQSLDTALTISVFCLSSFSSRSSHLLRLGQGERALATEKSFSKIGRVNFMLQKRIDRLNQVAQLAESLHVEGKGDSCNPLSKGLSIFYRIEHERESVFPVSGPSLVCLHVSLLSAEHWYYANDLIVVLLL